MMSPGRSVSATAPTCAAPSVAGQVRLSTKSVRKNSQDSGEVAGTKQPSHPVTDCGAFTLRWGIVAAIWQARSRRFRRSGRHSGMDFAFDDNAGFTRWSGPRQMARPGRKHSIQCRFEAGYRVGVPDRKSKFGRAGQANHVWNDSSFCECKMCIPPGRQGLPPAVARHQE